MATGPVVIAILGQEEASRAEAGSPGSAGSDQATGRASRMAIAMVGRAPVVRASRARDVQVVVADAVGDSRCGLSWALFLKQHL
jgi:hypothetical protein